MPYPYAYKEQLTAANLNLDLGKRLESAGGDASAVVWTATGGNAARTAADRMLDRGCVARNHGAIGDGVSRKLSAVTTWYGVSSVGWSLAQWQVFFPFVTTLDTELDQCGIQSAINYAAARALPARIEAGTFIAATLTYAAGLAGLYGDGRDATTIKRPDNDTAGHFQITGTGASPVNIANLTLDGNKLNNTFYSSGIVIPGGDITLENVEVLNQKTGTGYGTGIQALQLSDEASGTVSLIRNCVVHDNDADGILIYGVVFGLGILANRCYDNGGNGIRVAASGSQPTGQQKYVYILDNECSKNGSAGISAGSFTQFLTFPCQFFFVNGNICFANGSYGLAFSADQGSALDNVLVGNGATTYLGNMLFNGSNSTVRDIASEGAFGWGIDAGGSRDSTVSDCRIRGSRFSSGSGNGLNFGGCINVDFDDITLIDNGGSAGTEVGGALNDGPGLGAWRFPWDTANVRFSRPRLTLSGTNPYGFRVSGGITGLMIEDARFIGGTDAKLIYGGAATASFRGNRRADSFSPPSVAAGSTVVYPDFADVVQLTGAGTTVNLIQSNTQYGAVGQVTAIVFTNRGAGYTAAATATISGDGAGATAITYLGSATTPCPLGSTEVQAGGSGYTYATVAYTGGGGAGAAGTVHVGYPTLMDGHPLTLINASGNNQIIANGSAIKLAGGVNCTLTDKSSITFRIADGGIAYEVSRSIL